MKRLISILLIIMMSVSLLAACGQEEEKETASQEKAVQRVGVSMPSRTTQRWNQDGAYIVSELQAAGMQADLQFADDDSDTQLQQIEQMIEGGCSALIIAAVDGSALTEVLKKAQDKGIRVLAYDRMIMDSAAVSAYISFNSETVGKIQAESIRDALKLDTAGKTFTIELFGGSEKDMNSKALYDGAMEVLQPYIEAGTLKVKSGEKAFADITTELWLEAVAKVRMRKLLKQYYDDSYPDAVLCPNDNIASAVAEALMEAGCNREHFPVITGQDANILSVQNLQRGYQSMTVFKDTRKLAKEAVSLLNADSTIQPAELQQNGATEVPCYYLEPVPVNVENYKEVLIDSGYYRGSQVNVYSDSPVKGNKIAYIINMAHSEIFDSCAAKSIEIAERLGMSCDTFFSNGDDGKFKKYITDCAKKGYNGLFLSHGGEDYSYEFLQKLCKAYPDLRIVTFDTQFKDASGKPQKIDGVTQFFQDDADLAEILLDYICTELAPEASPAKVLKVWVGDYTASFDRREIGYQKYEKLNKIQTVETIGPADYVNVTESMYQVMKETLKKYDEDDIDAIWVAYDAYAQGCYRAVMESGKKIPIVSADISNEDVECMKEPNSVWKACACTDFKANGEMGVRILALELNGEYEHITDIKSGKPTDTIEIPASLITWENLPGEYEEIEDTAPDSYGAVSNFVTSSWLKEYIGY